MTGNVSLVFFSYVSWSASPCFSSTTAFPPSAWSRSETLVPLKVKRTGHSELQHPSSGTKLIFVDKRHSHLRQSNSFILMRVAATESPIKTLHAPIVRLKSLNKVTVFYIENAGDRGRRRYEMCNISVSLPAVTMREAEAKRSELRKRRWEKLKTEFTSEGEWIGMNSNCVLYLNLFVCSSAEFVMNSVEFLIILRFSSQPSPGERRRPRPAVGSQCQLLHRSQAPDDSRSAARSATEVRASGGRRANGA